ncbi:hypothetical protein D9M68_1003140 [compost metagenome]
MNSRLAQGRPRRVYSSSWVKRITKMPQSAGKVMRSSQTGTGALGQKYWKPWPVMLRMNTSAEAVASTYQR